MKTVIETILVIGLMVRVVCGVSKRPVIGECGVILMWTAVLTGSWEFPLFGYGVSKGMNAGLLVSLLVPLMFIGIHLFKIAILKGWVNKKSKTENMS